jgi:hypothetical protein
MSIPQLSYPAKTVLCELNTAEIFVVMLIRLRRAAQIDSETALDDWRAGLQAVGVASEGADAFDLLMHLFGSVLRLPLDVRNLRCDGLGEGEAWLLQIISLLQHDRYDVAEAILSRWLPPGAARIAALQAQRFCRALTVTGLIVPLRSFETAQLPLYKKPLPHRRMALVH